MENLDKELIKKRQLELLKETVAYYGEDTSRRALNKKGHCCYKTSTGKKCAVGRLFLPREYRKSFEEKTVRTKKIITSKGGKRLIGLYRLDFLTHLQNLHDGKYFWEKGSGMTDDGLRQLSFIEKNIESGVYVE